MYIKKMYSLVSSVPPFKEVPGLLYTHDTIQLQAVAESNGHRLNIDAHIVGCLPVTGEIGKYSIIGYMSEEQSDTESSIIGIINTLDSEESALFLAVR